MLYGKFVLLFFSPSGFRGLAREPHLPTTRTLCHTNGPLRWLQSRLADHYHVLLLLRRPQQQQQQQQHLTSAAATRGTCSLLVQYRLLQHLQLSICHPKGTRGTPYLAGASLATAAVVTPGATTTRTKATVTATFSQKLSPVWANFTKF